MKKKNDKIIAMKKTKRLLLIIKNIGVLSVFFLVLFSFTLNAQSKQNLARDLAYFTRLLEQSPNDPDVNYNIAQVYFFMGKLDEAIKHLEITLFFRPDDYEAAFKKALIYKETGRLRDARKTLVQLCEKNSTDARVWYELGVTYSDLADYNKSVSAFQKALQHCKKEEEKYRINYYAGLVHLSNRDFSGFKDCLDRLRGSEIYHENLLRVGRLWKSDLD